MNIEALVHHTKERRRSLGLVSVYTGVSGPFEMAHPNEAHKRFYDFKYALRAMYPTEADVPAEDMQKLRSLRDAMRAAQ